MGNTISRFKRIITQSAFYQDNIRIYYQILLKPYIEKQIDLKKDIVRSYGDDNPDKTFFVIPCAYDMMGTFETWMWVAYRYLYARSCGYLPVIDMKNYKVNAGAGFAILSSASEMESENCWDLVFKQPGHGYSLEDVYNSKNVVLGVETDIEPKTVGNKGSFSGMTKWHSRLYHEVYEDIGFNDEIMKNVGNIDLPMDTVGIPLRRCMECGNKRGDDIFVNYPGHHTRGFMPDYIKWIDNGLKRGFFNYFFDNIK